MESRLSPRVPFSLGFCSISRVRIYSFVSFMNNLVCNQILLKEPVGVFLGQHLMKSIAKYKYYRKILIHECSNVAPLMVIHTKVWEENLKGDG